MKALTIKQPWAGLIISGVKDIENRSWKTNYRGRIYVHAAQKPVPMNGDDNGFMPPSIEAHKQLFKLHPTSEGRWPDILAAYPNSCIIGEVDIIDCVIDHPSVWAEKSPLNELAGIVTYNWVLANPLKYSEPILNVKGSLSFWEYIPLIEA
jgi:hypothetical protein